MASEEFQKALDALRRGQVVVAATDTLVGLLVDASNPDALDRLSALKVRGAGQAFALIAPSLGEARALLHLTAEARALAEEHWPGPLTLVAAAKAPVDARLMLDGKVGVRVPSPCDAHALSVALGRSVTATSANFPGEAAPVATEELDAKLRRAVESGGGVVLEGRGPGGPASTLVDVSQGLRVLRVGAIPIPSS